MIPETFFKRHEITSSGHSLGISIHSISKDWNLVTCKGRILPQSETLKNVLRNNVFPAPDSPRIANLGDSSVEISGFEMGKSDIILSLLILT